MTRPALLLSACWLSALLLAPPAAAQYAAQGDDHFVGQPTPVTLPAGADTLVVTYRPSTSIAHLDRFPVRGSAFSWTPTEAGVVALSTPGGETQNVSVRFRETPASGLFVLLGAGLVLFGGAAFAFRKLFEEDDPPAA